jgi:hypothetical protein
MGEVGRNPIGGAVAVGTLPGVMTGWCCMTPKTISKSSMVEDDDMPTVLIVAVGTGAAIMVGWRSMTVLTVGQLLVG